MTSCSCDKESQTAQDTLFKYQNLSKQYVSANTKLELLRAAEESLGDKWFVIACAVASVAVIGVGYTAAVAYFAAVTARERQEEKVNELKDQMSEAENTYNEALEEYEKCLNLKGNNLKGCSGCGGEFKPEYITTCKGCGGDYCDTCFDAGIEAWELKQ